MSTSTLHIEKKKTSVPELRFKGFIDEWKQKRLGEIAKITTGSTPNTLIEEYYNGEKLFVSPADIQENRYVYKTKTTLTESGFSKGRKVAKGSVLFVCIGSTIGKIAQATEECLTNQQINALYAIKDYDNNFIYELLEKNGAKIKLLAGVQAVPQINKTDFSNFKYFLPTLPEQQKIASFLSAVDEKIQQISRKKELLEHYKKGLMQQLFSGKLRFKDENGRDYPDWEEKKLGDIAKRVIRKNKENNLNVLTISAQLGLVSQLEYFNKSVSAKDVTNYYLLERNDFAYNKSYSNGYPMGAIKRLKKYDKGVVSTLYICFCFNEIVSLNFMEQYFEHGLHNSEIEKVAQEGARNHGLLNIGVNDFFNIDLIIPSLKEQQKIADFLSSIDAKIDNINQQLNQTQSFKKGLLQQLFV